MPYHLKDFKIKKIKKIKKILCGKQKKDCALNIRVPSLYTPIGSATFIFIPSLSSSQLLSKCLLCSQSPGIPFKNKKEKGRKEGKHKQAPLTLLPQLLSPLAQVK